MLRAWGVLVALALGACDNPPVPVYPQAPVEGGGGPDDSTHAAQASIGKLDAHLEDFIFEGGYLEFELYRNGTHITQVARNRYAVPVMVHWWMTAFDNVQPTTPVEGVTMLPAAPSPKAAGQAVILGELSQVNPQAGYRRELYFRARFGDPRAAPAEYVYGLPFPNGQTFTVLQGFHGAFSHRGSNEYAVDFDCPVATPVLATRPGVVVAANGAAQGAGTTPDFLDYKKTNFVLVQHDDGTIGEYMHLSPSGIEVKPGQRVERGQELALSGNTGFSSTPHLHFQVMTAGSDGLSARSFPFVFAIAPQRVEEPQQGKRYAGWEPRSRPSK